MSYIAIVAERSYSRLVFISFFDLIFSFSSLLSCRFYLLLCMVWHSMIPGSDLEQGVWSGMNFLLDT